jgi:hypothetical protein
MVVRVGRRGTNAGRAFRRCTEFPVCAGTRPVVSPAARRGSRSILSGLRARSAAAATPAAPRAVPSFEARQVDAVL